MLSALTVLDAANNEIEDIHEAALRLPRLKELELAFNRLAVLPPSLGDLTALRRLTLQVRSIRRSPQIGNSRPSSELIRCALTIIAARRAGEPIAKSPGCLLD